MANLSNVINVALLPEGRSLARDNMNVTCIVTSDTGFLSTAKRFEVYSDAASVAEDFGSSSDAYQYALVFFSQKPNPINAGGLLVIGHWRAAEETAAATAGILTGAQVSEDSLIPQLRSIQDGSFDIEVDGATENITGLDFRTVIDLGGIVTLLNAELSGATASVDNQKIIITSDTTGSASEAGLAVVGGAGTFVGNILNIASGTGAVSVDGAASGAIGAETKVEAVTAIKSEVNFKGFTFAPATTDQESKDLATWAQANAVLNYDVFTDASNLEIDVTNPVWEITLAGQDNTRMIYSKSGNRKIATAYMARMHTVLFTATNTAITMNLKELIGIVAEEYSQGDITKAKNVGLDIYTTFKNVPKLLVSGANGQTDNVYNLLAFVDAVQTDAFNLLGTTATKIPQTDRGIGLIVDTVDKSCAGFVRAGVFAAGTWSISDFFGDLETFERNIAAKGYYVLAESLAEQVQSDRAARIAPPINVAVKNAGAVHKIDIIIRFNI